MPHGCRVRGLPLMLLFFVGLIGRPALAQTELSGQWSQKLFEDWPERNPGPWIGDYTGMPINDQDRMRGDTWDAAKWEMTERQCQPHPADYAPRGPGDLRIWPDVDRLTQGIRAWNLTTQVDASASDYLHGWPPASARVGSAHLARILHRGMGRRRAENNHDPSQRGLGQAQRARPQSAGHDDRIPGSSPSLPHAGYHRGGPALSDEAI